MGFRIILDERKICRNNLGMEGTIVATRAHQEEIEEKPAKIKSTTLFYDALGSMMT